MTEPLRVRFLRKNNGVQLQIETGGLALPTAELIPPEGLNAPDFFLNFFLKASEEVYFRHLPADSCEFEIDQSIESLTQLYPAVESIVNVIGRTNDLLKRWRPLKNTAKDFEHILFYSADDHSDLKVLAADVIALLPHRATYETFSTGWNKDLRKWEKPSSYSIEALVEKIQREKIARIVVTNMYYLKHCLRDAVHALAILRWLGVELVIVDLDVYDAQWNFTKATFNDSNVRRFCTAPHLAKAWDKFYGLKNVHYIPPGFRAPVEDNLAPLDKDFEVVVASHARIEGLLPLLDQVLIILDACSEQNIYDDLQLWYFSFRAYILARPALNLAEREHANQYLFLIYVQSLTFLKYETISQLKTARPLRIYGDEGWKYIFPEFFEGHYLQNYDEVFRSKKSLQLLLNANFSYLEVNPVFHKALELQVPFLGFPALAHTPELEGFRAIEYRNPIELSEKIELVNELSFRPEVLKSRKYAVHMIKRARSELAMDLSQKTNVEDKTFFELECEAHQKIADKRIADYLATHEVLIASQFAYLFQNTSPAKPADESRFRHRVYTERLKRLTSGAA